MVDEQFTLRTHDSLDDETIAQLWAESGRDFVMTAFQARGFLEAFYRHMPSDCTAIMVSVTEATSGRLAMVLPLIKRETAMMRYIEAPDLDLADYVAPAMAQWFDPDAQQMASIWAQLRRTLPRADILSLKKIPALLPDGRTNPLTLLPDTVPMGTTTKTIALQDADSDDHYQRAGIYKDGKRLFRRLQKEGNVEFRIARTEDEASEIFDHLLRQRTARFEALERFDPLADPRIQAFYRELAVRGTPAGQVFLAGLYVDGKCIATDLSFVHGDRYVRILIAIANGDLERFSPGTVLFTLILDETRARGVAFYDLGIGEIGYKKRFPGATMQIYERHEALSQRGQFAVLQTWARRMIRHGIKSYPQLRGPAEQVRRKLRQLRG